MIDMVSLPLRTSRPGDSDTGEAMRAGRTHGAALPRLLASMSLLCSLLAWNMPAWASDVDVIQPFATVHMDVAPGFFREFASTLSHSDDHGGLGAEVRARMTKLQSSVIWRPVLSLCAVSNEPERYECIEFSTNGNDNVVLVKTTSQRGAGELQRSPLELPIELHSGESFRVSLRVAAKRSLTFAVNGSDSRSVSLDFDAEKYTIGCSSMVCDLALTDLRPPDPVKEVGLVSRTDADLLTSARLEIEHGDFDAGMQGVSRFIDLYPLLSAPYAQRALAWLGMGQLDRALADLDKALTLESQAKSEDANGDESDHLFYLGSTTPSITSLRDQVRSKLQLVPCPKRVGTDCA